MIFKCHWFMRETENRANVIAGQTAAIDVCKCDDNYSEENVENKKTKEIKRGAGKL